VLSYYSTSVSGMLAQQTAVDVIGNNVANVNTPGFKRSEVSFRDLLYAHYAPSGDYGTLTLDDGRIVDVGVGVRLGGVTIDTRQGALMAGQMPLNMAIEGEGYFIVRMPDGSAAYTRDGSFHLDGGRRLSTVEGGVVQPALIVPPDAGDAWVSDTGLVFARFGEGGEVRQIGEVQIARFVNPAGLLHVENNLSVATEASGPPTVGYPGSGGFGAVLGGAVETSNVNMATEVTSLIMAQRAYALNARALQAIDEMIGLANSLRA
jgi:flagellar basal-body rod protein FlgG